MSASADLLFLGPRRAVLYRKLERVMTVVDEGGLPMVIKEVYLFGSFLRDKQRPTDIDVLLIYDSDATLNLYESVGKKGDKHWRLWEMSRAPGKLRRCLKANAEKSVDLSICPSLEEYQRDLAYPMDIWLRIWTRQDRDWRIKLMDHFDQAVRTPLPQVSPA